jgi:hypothetical protein
MRLFSFVAATIVLAATPALAQPGSDPFAPPREGVRDEHGPRPRNDDFRIETVNGDVLLIDARSGCIWRRSPGGAGYGPSWVHEFPEGYRTACADRIGATLFRLKEGTN